MSFDLEVDKLIGKLVFDTKVLDLHCPYHLSNIEADSAYFVSIRLEFEKLKRVIQCISGSLLLVEFGSKHDITSSMLVSKKLLDEAREKIYGMKVPVGLRSHYQLLSDTATLLNLLFVKYNLLNNMNYLSKKQVKDVSIFLRSSYDKIKNAAGFSVGLDMISLESSCACGRH